jgi:hypothetical protein
MLADPVLTISAAFHYFRDDRRLSALRIFLLKQNIQARTSANNIKPRATRRESLDGSPLSGNFNIVFFRIDVAHNTALHLNLPIEVSRNRSLFLNEFQMETRNT